MNTQLLAVLDDENGVVARFEYAGGRMPVAMVQGGEVYYLAYDQVGSLRAVYTAAGDAVRTVEYDAWGGILDEDIAQDYEGLKVPFGFAGGLHDRDTGLVLFGLRNYDPETGRWTSRDPIGLAGGDTDLYAYCGNDPVNAVDPSGLYYTVGSVWAGITEGALSVGSSALNIVSAGHLGTGFLEQASEIGGMTETLTYGAAVVGMGAAGIAVSVAVAPTSIMGTLALEGTIGAAQARFVNVASGRSGSEAFREIGRGVLGGAFFGGVGGMAGRAAARNILPFNLGGRTVQRNWRGDVIFTAELIDFPRSVEVALGSILAGIQELFGSKIGM